MGEHEDSNKDNVRKRKTFNGNDQFNGSGGGGALLHKQQNTVDFKDFRREIRGSMDTEHLLEKCAVVLDLEVGLII